MPSTNTSPFPIDRDLVAVAVAYKDPDNSYIADAVLPRLPARLRREFKYHEYDIGTFFSVGDNKVGRISTPNVVDLESTEKTSKAIDYGLDSIIPYADIREAQAEGYSLESRRVEFLAQQNKILREKRVADLVFAAATYPVGYKVQLAGNDKWTDQVNSDPIGDINAAIDAALQRPNVAAFGLAAWRALSTHPAILKAINKSSGDKGNATRQAVADLFELQEVLVGQGRKNTAMPGQAPTLVRLWGPHAVFFHRNQTADNTAGLTFGYTYQVNATGNGSAIVAGRMEEKNIGLEGSVRVRAGEVVKELIAANAAAYFIEDAA